MSALRILSVVTMLLIARVCAAQTPERHKYDQRDLAMMTATARERFEQGETLLEAGDYTGALAILQPVAREALNSAIVPRRICEALTALGRRDEAIRSCWQAVTLRGSAMDFRPYVAALMAGNGPPTPEEMSKAVVFARRAVELGPNLPLGYAAECDIARRLGDAEMLNECSKQLERVAPDHQETLRAKNLAAPLASRLRVAAGWIVLIVASLGTLVHALRRARRRTLSRAGAVALGCCLVGALMSRPAIARDEAPARNPDPGPPPAASIPTPGHFSRFEINDQNPLASVPPKDKLHADPLQYGYYIMDLTDRAENAAKRGDNVAALRYWQTLAKVSPDRSFAFSKLCATYEALGDWAGAVYSCGAVLERLGVMIKDYTHYVGLVLSKKGDLTFEEVTALDKVIAHLKTDETGKGIADELACRIGARLRSAERLAPCTAALVAHAPNHPDAIYFQWALAAARGKGAEARQFIERAKEVSLKPEDIQYMEKETERVESRWKNLLGLGIGLVIVVASGAGLLASKRRSSKATKDAEPSGAAA